MTWNEIASTRITGISTPFLGFSWNPPPKEKDIAYRLITYLEDKRVLYNPSELENPAYCQQSVLQIREFITGCLMTVDGKSEIGIVLRTMRSAYRNFMNTIEHFKETPGMNHRYQLSMSDAFVFDSGIGQLRLAIGIELAKLFIMYRIDCEGELLTILPPPID